MLLRFPYGDKASTDWPFFTVLQIIVSSSLRVPLAWLAGGWVLAPPLRIHSCRVKWSPDTAEATESGTTATWVEPLKEKTRDESEDGRVGSAAVQLVAGDGGGRRSTSPLTAPENINKNRAGVSKISKNYRIIEFTLIWRDFHPAANLKRMDWFGTFSHLL